MGKTNLPYNPKILGWARERCALPLETVAEKLHTSTDKLLGWETGESTPNSANGRKLAKLYNINFLDFFLDKIPDIKRSELIPDFRLLNKKTTDAERHELLVVQEWAETQRLNALDMIESLNAPRPVFSDNLMFKTSDSTETAASIIREAINFSIEEQLELPKSNSTILPNTLREKIEAMDILVLKNTSMIKNNARGMCLFEKTLPVIVFGNESPQAQAFTLMHEFGHVLLRQSAISEDKPIQEENPSNKKIIEKWCNSFAASFLIPLEMLEDIFPKPAQPFDNIERTKIKELAKEFRISEHAMLIRLTNIGYIASSFYWTKMRPIFLKEEEEYTGFGRPPYYGKRYINKNGNFYTSLVLEAWGTGIIGANNATEYMGINNISHLLDIRDNFNKGISE